jgi:hypothetical protein
MADDEAPVPFAAEEREVIEWRLDRLLKAGYDHPRACDLALRTEIDLHRACDLARDCGPDLAARILS